MAEEKTKNNNNNYARAQLWREQNVTVVGLSGKIGSGKTCAAETIQKSFPNTVVRNFADRLKEEVAMHLEIDLALCYSHDGKNMRLDAYGMTLGEFLQQWGTRLRDIHPEIWVLAVQSFIDACVKKKASKDEKLIVCIGDCRFPNECMWVNSVGGIVIRLNGDPGGERARSKRDMSHISETALDAYQGFDLIVDTNRCDKKETAQRILDCIASQQTLVK